MSYWQLRCAEMKQRSAHLYQSGLWSDCSFKLGEDDVKAHKLIMAAASPVFGKLFYGKEAAKSPVPIYDTRPEVFRILLEYIYSDHINLTNLRDACDLHNAAFKWRLPYLKEMCIKFISSSLDADNVICIYELACQSKEFHLQDDCIKFFKTLTKEILKAESFKEAKLSTVLKIFSMDTLNIDSELDLFKAAVNHAAAQEVEDEGLKRALDHSEDCFTPADGPSQAKRSRIDTTGIDSAVEIETNNDTSSDTPAVNASPAASRQESHYVSEHDYDGDSPRENDMTAESYADYEDKLLKANIKATRREKYRDLMRKIRFLTLTPQEFAECTTLSFLLPTSAIMALSLNISAKDTFVPMPKHFSTSMVPRNLSQQNEREKQAGSTRVTVNNIRNLKKFESNPFYIRNLAWTLMLMRLQETIEDITKDILIMAVTCFFEKGVPEWIGKVEVRVSFISEVNINDRFQDMKLKLSQPCNDYGAWIIKTEWNDLMSAHGIIEDNTVTCKVYVSTNIHKSPTSPDSSPDNTQTDYITTPLRSSTPVSRARYLKEKTQKRSDLTASELAGTRSRTPRLPENQSLTPLLPEKRSLTPLLPEKRSLTPLLPEKRCLTPMLPEKRSLTPLLPEKRSQTPQLPEKRSLTPVLPEKQSLTPLLPEKRSSTPLLPEKRILTPLLLEKRSLTPLLPEKRSLTPLLSEKCSVPSPSIEKRSLTPLLPEKRSLTPSPLTEKRPLTPQLPEKSLSDRSLTPLLPDKRLPPVLSEKRSGSPLTDKHGVAKSPLKRNLSPLPEERNITPPPVENRILPPRPKKRYLTQSPTEKHAGSHEKSGLTSSPIENSNLPIRKNGPDSSPLPPNNNATPPLPEKHVSRPTSLPINTKLPLSTSTQSIPASTSTPSVPEVVMRPKQTGNNTGSSPQTLNSPVVGPINLKSYDPSIETLKLSVSSKDKPRALTCVQILRSLHRKGYPMNGSIAQRYLNELSAMSINGFQVLRPLLAYANASAATNGSGHIVPAIMEKKRDVVSPMNSANSASRLLDENNTKSVTKSKPDQKENEPLISEPFPKYNVSFASESMAIIDNNSAIWNLSDLTDCTNSVNEQKMKQLAPKPLALKDDVPSISEPIPKRDTVSSVSEPMAIPEDIRAISNPSADCTDSISENTKQLAPKPLALKDDVPSISEPIPKKDTGSIVSQPMAIPENITAISNASADCTDSISEITKQLAPKPLALKDDGPSISEPIPKKDIGSFVSEPMTLTDDMEVISNPPVLIDGTDSIKMKEMTQLAPKPLAPKDDGPLIMEPSPLKDTVSSASKPMTLTDDMEVISNPPVLIDGTDSIKMKDIPQQETKSLLNDNEPSISEPIPIRNNVSSELDPMAIVEENNAISSPSTPMDCTDSINENTKQLVLTPLASKDNEPSISELIHMKDSVFSVSEPMAITDNITVISNPSAHTEYTDSPNEHNIKQLASIAQAPKDNEPSISEPIPIKDSSLIEPFTSDDSNSTFKPLIIAECSILDPLPSKSLALLHSKDSNYETSTEQVHAKSPVPVISEPMLLNDGVSLSEPMVLNDDTLEVVSADEKNKEQLAPYPLPLKDNKPLILEPMCLKEADKTTSVSEFSSNKNAPNIMSEKSEAESSTKDGINTVLKQSDDEKNKDQTTLQTLALQAISLVSDPNLKENIPTVPQSLDSSVDGDSVLKPPASNNNSSCISDSISLKYDDSATSEIIDLIDSNDSNLKRDSIENPLDVKKDTSSSNIKSLADDKTSPTPIDLMESDDVHPDTHTIKAQLTNEPTNSEPVALNDTILFDTKPVAVPLLSNPSVLNDNLSSASKPTDLMEIFDTISELHTLEAQLTKLEPLALNDTILLDAKPAAVPLVSESLVLNDNLSSASNPMDLMEIFDTISELHTLEAKLTKSEPLALNDTILLDAKPAAVPLVSDSLVHDNLTSASKPMDLMEIFETISELHTLEAKRTLGDKEPLKSEPVALNDTILLEPKSAAVPLVSNPLILNDNLTSASKPMDLMEIFDTISELRSLDAQLTKSKPLALNDTILSDSKALAVPLVSDSLVLNDNLTSASKPMDLMEIFDTISELQTISSTAPNDTIPLETKPVTVKVTKVSVSSPLTLSVCDPLALSGTIPSVSNTLTLNENLSSTAEPIYLKDSADANPESHSVDSRLILGDTESSKSEPSAPIHTIPSESMPVVLKDNVTTLSKPLVFIENVPSTFDSPTSIANPASEPMDITDSNIVLTTKVSLTQRDVARTIPETMELKEIAPSVSKDAQSSNSGITCMPAFDKDSSVSSEAILKCRRNLMTLKHLKYPMCGTLAQKYLKTLKDLTDKSGTNVTTNFDPKSRPSSLINKASMSEEAKVTESKQTLILINRQILMSLKSLKYPMSGPLAQKHLKALLDLTNKTQEPRTHALKSAVSQLAPRSKENSIDDLKKNNDL